MSVATDGGNSYRNTRLIVVMGTTGCGKSTIGECLSQRMNAAYLEGDDYHSADNKEKMAAGIALTDDDRWPWLKALSDAMRISRGKTVTSCSSLKRSYRDFFTANAKEPVLFVYLKGTRELLAFRLSERQGHFMNTGLLDSQLETLEPPEKDEFSLTVDINATVDDIIENIETTILSSNP